MTTQPYELISFKLCPYVQRSVITLMEKEVPFIRRDIDLGNKPEWFKQLSPTGKVPMLLIKENSPIFESAVICEYIDETTPGTLLPASPVERAQHRSWIQFGSDMLNAISRLYSANNREEYETHLNELANRFSTLENHIKGPFFGGENFQMVDAVYAPIFRYFDVFESRTPLDLFHISTKRLNEWRQSLRQRDSVKQAVSSDYAESLIAFVISKKSHLGSLLI